MLDAEASTGERVDLCGIEQRRKAAVETRVVEVGALWKGTGAKHGRWVSTGEAQDTWP
jgi:hypothetical protein